MTIRICGDVEMEKIRIGDVCDILNGYAFKSENYARSGIRIIRISNVQKGYIEDTTPAFYPIETADLDRFMLEQGDLLVSLTGNVGRVAILGKELLPAALNQRVACLRLKSDKISKNYLFHILNSNFFEQQCIMASNGVAQKNLSTEWLKNYEVPCYERDQQEKIVMVLSTIQSVISGRKHELQKLDDLVKARFVEMFGIYPANPKGWETGTIRDVVSDVRYGSSRPAVDGGKYPYLRMNNITYGGELDLSDTKRIDIPDNELDKCTVRRGDVLFNRTNSKELVGKTCVYNRDDMMVLAGFVIRVRVSERILPEFLSEFLNTEFSKQMLLAMCKTAIGQANINAQEMQNIGLYLPPIELQRKFVQFKEQTDKSKVAVQKALDEAQLLFDSLMQKYFG